MKRIIACRPGCYDLPLPEALAELKAAGIGYAEINAPADGDFDRLRRIASDAGVVISTLGTGARVDDPDDVAAIERAIDGAAQIGTRIIFLAAALKGASYEGGIEGLRHLAGRAARAGVVLSIETHVPFGHNSAEACRTLAAVDSPGLGFNFDTANIYYYNPKGIDAVGELTKALPHVTSMHLKESARGEPKAFEFPVLGQGIVDFPSVFRLLDERGYTGPYTLELEGPLVAGLTTDERTAKVKACLDYLRGIGAMEAD